MLKLSLHVAATLGPPCLFSAPEYEHGTVIISSPLPDHITTPPHHCCPHTNIQDPHFPLTILSNSLIEKQKQPALMEKTLVHSGFALDPSQFLDISQLLYIHLLSYKS